MTSWCGAGFFEAWAEIAPAMGMIGTLVGLVLMLGNMSDPKAIGPAMAIALLTTLYGAILANVVLIPCAMKLKTKSSMESLNNELIIEGVMFINDGGNPRIMGDMLGSFLDSRDVPSRRSDSKAAEPWLMMTNYLTMKLAKLLRWSGSSSSNREEPPVKCEECAPWGGAPAG